MASNNLVLKISIAIIALFICCSSKAQGYKILVLNPNELENNYNWDHKRTEIVEGNDHPSISKPSKDDECLGALCLPDDDAMKPIPEYPDRKKKLGGLRVTYDHNIPRIVYWPIYEEEI